MTSTSTAMSAAPIRAETTPPLLVVAAMKEELAGFTVTRRGTMHDDGGVAARSASIAGESCMLAATGDGATAARRGVERALDSLQPRGVMIVGISGGLAPHLEAGTTIVGRSVIDAHGAVYHAEPRWLSVAERCLHTTSATLLTSPSILGSQAEKAAAHRGDERPAAVDLETAIYAEAALRRRLPWLALRVVCDPAGEDLPLDLERCRGRNGRVDRRRVLLALLRRPRALAGLLALRARLTAAARTLANDVETLLREGLP